MAKKEVLADASNTVGPVVLALHSLGFVVRREADSHTETWIAESEHLRLVAHHPTVLLGLATMRRIRGRSWLPSDKEIEAVLSKLDLFD